MIIPKAIFWHMLELLGADTATFNQAADNLIVRLFKNDFAPGLDMQLADFIQADFNGYAGILVLLGPCEQSIDPLTGDSIMDIQPATGAYLWETASLTSLPQTIYGYYVTDEGGTVVRGADRFPTPIVLTDENQRVSIGTINLRQAIGSIT